MLKVIIVEDEKWAANMLRDSIKMVAPDCQIEGIASNLKDTKELIDKVKPDLAFFDIELPDGHSFDFLATLQKINFAIIFTTAHSKYAVTAFQYSAIDFIVKPITPDLVDVAIQKAKESISQKQMDKKIENFIENQDRPEEEKKIILECADTIHFAMFKEIVHCQSDNNYTNIYLVNGEKIFVSKTLKEFEQLLPSSMFYRVHQSHIVNFSFIKQIKKRTFRIILNNGDSVKLATRKKDALLKIMKDRML